MPETPQLENPVGSFVNKLISLLVTGVAAPVIEKFAEAEFPLLAYPIVRQIFEHLVETYAGKLSFAMQDGAIVLVFNIQVGTELHTTLKALIDLQDAHKSGDANAIQKAIDNAVDSWANLGHWDGIATKH